MFGSVDIVVFVISTVMSLGIGSFVVWLGGNPKTGLKYFLGGRTQHLLPVLLSLLASNHSSILMLGGPAESYMYGAMYLVGFLGVIPLLPFYTRVTVPLFYRLKLTSIFQYFDKRFPSNSFRLLMVIIGSIRLIVYSGLVMFGPAVALQHVTPLPDWAIILGCSAITILYTCVGGFSAVIWTDVFQCLVMFAGMLAVLIKCTMESGGVSQVLTVASHHKRLDFFDFNPDPTVRHTFWTLVIGTMFQELHMPFSQSTIQRSNAMPNLRYSKYMIYAYLALLVFFEVLASACGVVAFVYYQGRGCDPLAGKLISNPNQIMIRTITDIFQGLPGLPGLYMSALLSASVSTFSSCLNGLAAIVYEDIIKVFWPHISDKKAMAISKRSVIVYGVITTGVAFMMRYVKGSLMQISLTFLGALTGPTIGIFLLTVFYKRLTLVGSFTGFFVGTVFGMWIMLGSQTMPPPPALPTGPIDRCPQMELNLTFHNVTNAYTYLPRDSATTVIMDNTNVTSMNMSNLYPSSDVAAASPDVQGIRKLYALSYRYFFCVSLLVSVIVGIIGSILKPSQYDVPADHLVSVKTFCCGCFQSKYGVVDEGSSEQHYCSCQCLEKEVRKEVDKEMNADLVLLKHKQLETTDNI